MYRAPLALLVVFALAGRACASGPWVDEIDALLVQQPGSGRAVVDLLERLPLEGRQTADYHWLLARAHRDAGQAGPAAEAVATHALLDPRGARDLGDVRAWLAQRGTELERESRAARARGDLVGAARAYLVAAKCRPSLLTAGDGDLGGEALGVVQRAADARPAKVGYRFQLGFLAYLYGKLELAREAWTEYLNVETDPYRVWRARTWLDRVSWELAPAQAPSMNMEPSMDGLERASASPARTQPSAAPAR